MDSFKGAFKFLLKAYFAGCLGCLGSLTAVVVLGLVISLAFGPSVLSVLKGIQLPSLLPGMAPQGSEMSPTESPDLSGPPPADCEKTIDAWVSKSEGGSPATSFSKTDGIYPVVANPTDCGAVNAKLLGPNDETILEKAYSVKGGGTNGYGNYNQARNLPPGSYKMQFWYGDNLLKTIELKIQ